MSTLAMLQPVARPAVLLRPPLLSQQHSGPADEMGMKICLQCTSADSNASSCPQLATFSVDCCTAIRCWTTCPLHRCGNKRVRAASLQGRAEPSCALPAQRNSIATNAGASFVQASARLQCALNEQSPTSLHNNNNDNDMHASDRNEQSAASAPVDTRAQPLCALPVLCGCTAEVGGVSSPYGSARLRRRRARHARAASAKAPTSSTPASIACYLICTSVDKEL